MKKKLTKKKLKKYFAKERSKWLVNEKKTGFLEDIRIYLNATNWLDVIHWCDIEYVGEEKIRESGFYHKQSIDGIMRSIRIPDNLIYNKK